MLVAKAIQIRDAGTNIPAVAARFSPSIPAEERIVRRAGFYHWEGYVLLTKLDPLETHYDAYKWGFSTRTMKIAHLAIAGEYTEEWCRNIGLVYSRMEAYDWDHLVSGQVVDVEWLLGVRDTPKEFE